MKDSTFTKFAFTPAGLCDGTLAVAACRAGGIGILNTELLHSTDTVGTIARQLDFISAKTSAEFGLKLDTAEADLLDLARKYTSRGLRWLIVDSETLPPADNIKKLRDDGIKILVETRNCHWPDRPTDLAIDALVLKGNEAGGFVGENSTFILLQQWLRKSDVPVFIRGGLTPSVAAAAAALGAAGGVFDSQILLMEESPLALQLKPLLQGLSGNETVAAGDNETGRFFRLLRRPGAGGELLAFIDQAAGKPLPELTELVRSRTDWFQPTSGLFPVGQDICFAGPWRERYGVLSALFRDVDKAVSTSLDIAVAKKPLDENSPLARSLNTPLPVVQGPMARVSDRAEFAAAVSRGGGLPVLGLALMRGKPLEALLSKTASLLGKASWGVGLLGFAEKELLDEQLTLISKYHPGYAVVAGGRPEQSIQLENAGIRAFLHIPAPELLALFLREGCRRFIFEGRECGGHIGPVNSLVLWSSMIEHFQLELREQKILPESVEILFAGGIHDALSSAMVQVMAAPLVDRGVKIGILMGSAYLFTKEIVSSRALVKTFQDQIIECDQTVSLETGPGHASRCAVTGFARYFFQKQRQLQRGKKSPEEIRRILDDLVLGRLNIASKGCGRLDESGSLCELAETRQKEEGMYMVGQLAILRDRPTDIVTLHRKVIQEAISLLKNRLPKPAPLNIRASRPLDIAVIGLGCLLPGATTTRNYWENILTDQTAIAEIPAHRWDWRLYYDNDRNVKDKIYSRWGGFLEDLPFDPSRYGMPPNSINHIDPMQLMALEIARQTLEDAGYPGKPFCRERTSVIIGASGGTGDVGMQYGLRSELPRFHGKLPEDIAQRLPEWTEDTFAGLLLNVIAGRIANRLDLHGVNFTTDAACASSLAAIYQAATELLTGRSDMVLAGGVDTVQGPFGYMCFSKTQALSPRGRCESLDESADGIVISEGIAMVALKRLEDAGRDGDRIYAVIKGVGGSSDGRAKGLTAPLPAGQLRAMKRAYEYLDFGPESVELFEAHGTGTAIGDLAELESTTTLLQHHGAEPAQAAIGSVKTLIGHTKAAAGISGLLKVVLALHHRVLPPHSGVSRPQEIFLRNDAPLYLPDKPRPWLRSAGHPRRGAVSAFGFGGTNFHVVLEEYSEEYRPWLFQSVRDNWPCELLIFSAGDRQELLTQINNVKDAAPISRVELRDMAASLAARRAPDGEVMAIIATDPSDLGPKLAQASEYLGSRRDDPGPGIYHSGLMTRGGKLAVLFPGQGAQYPDMLRELALHFPLVADTLAKADTVTRDDFANRFAPGNLLSHFIFPRGCYDEASQKDAARKITSTDIAQPALGAVESSLWLLMGEFGLTADMAGGHSYGEFVALFAAGILDFETLMHISVSRGRLIADIGKKNNEAGTMAAVMAPREQVEEILAGVGEVVVANHNAPLQSVISGPTAEVKKAVEQFSNAGTRSVMIPVSAAFHSPLIKGITGEFSAVIDRTDWTASTMPVYSNTTGGPHADDVKTIKATMTRHLASPLEFVTEIKSMYADGARTFLELGPKSILGGLTEKILEDAPCNIISSEDKGTGLPGFLHMLGRLICAGHQVDLTPLFKGRDCLIGDPLDVSSLSRHRPRPNHVWLLNGSGARRINEPVRQIGVTVEDLVSLEESNKEQLLPKKETPDMDKHHGESADHAELMKNYLDMMRQFLETQERVMSMYLQGGGSATPVRRRSHTLRVPRRPSPPSAASAAGSPQARTEPEPAAQSQPPREDMAGKPAPAATDDNLQPGSSQESGNDRQPTPAQTGMMDRDKLTATLLKIVEEKTGYPQDMIGLEQNLEADLGIDSIKRVEIVGELLKVLPEDRIRSMGEEEHSQLNTQSTLKGMVDILLTEGEDSHPFDQTGAEQEVLAADLPSRYIIEPVAEPLDGKAATHLTTGFFIITEDDMGLAGELAGLLSAKGCKPILLPHQVLEDEQSLEQWCAALTVPAGELAGIIHTTPVSAQWLPTDAKSDQWRAELFSSEKSFFMLLHRTLPLLHDNAHIVAVSGLGGSFCRLAVPHEGLSLQGGAVGLIKSLLEEKPNFRLKAIDLDPDLEPSRMAELVLAETELVGGRQEVGYPRGERTIFKTVPAAIPEHEGNMPANMVVFATGGAKGITAETLRVLAQPGNILVLAGRSGLPEEEPAELKKLVSLADIQRYFIEEVRAGRLDLTPAEIRRRAMKILSDRELLANMEDFRSKGAKVTYYQLDITDENGVKTLFENLYEKYGAIHGIVHGAGVIEDKLLEDKTAESWSRVVETKVIGLMLMPKYIRPESLKFFTVFSSVAGRYGNSGQTDYATANELMNRICCQLRRVWPQQVTIKALCWGPWGPTRYGSGMVTPETEKKFLEKGVVLVQSDQGRKLFADEVLVSYDPAVEIICGQGKWEEHEAEKGKIFPKNHPTPFFSPTETFPPSDQRKKKTHILLGRRHRYLDEHRIDDIPVLPAAAAAEMIAEGASLLYPDRKVIALHELRLLNGIKITSPDQEIVLELDSGEKDGDTATVTAALTSAGDNGRQIIHYRCKVLFARELPAMPDGTHTTDDYREKSLSVTKAYDEWLFHGPVFQVIETIHGMSTKGALAELRRSEPGEWLSDIPERDNRWILDPAVLDAAPQMGLLWARMFRSESALPVRFGRITRYVDRLPSKLSMEFRRREPPEPSMISAEVLFTDSEGKVVLKIEDLNCVSSKELNRLGGTARVTRQ